MGPVLLQEEIRVSGEDLRYKVESNWTTLFMCDQSNFNQIIARYRNGTLITMVRDTCTTTVQPVPPATVP